MFNYMRPVKILSILLILTSCFDSTKKLDDNKTYVRLLWRKPSFEWITSSIFIKDKTIYFGSFNDNFYSTDLISGEEKFKFKTGYDPYFLPIVTDNKIYFSSFDLNIYCIDTLGKLYWKVPTTDRVKNNLLDDDSLLYVSVRSDGLKAINKSNGSLVWHLTQKPQSLSTNQPIMLNDNIYLGLWELENNVIAVNKQTGKIIWSNKYSDFSSSDPALSTKGLVVSIDKYYKGGQVKMLDYNTGKEIWSSPLNCEALYKPFTDNKNVIVSTYDSKIVCLDQVNGKMKWELQLQADENAETEFCFFKKHIYFGTTKRNLYCVNINNGKTVFKESFNYGISKPIVSNDKIYIPTGGVELWTLKE